MEETRGFLDLVALKATDLESHTKYSAGTHPQDLDASFGKERHFRENELGP